MTIHLSKWTFNLWIINHISTDPFYSFKDILFNYSLRAVMLTEQLKGCVLPVAVGLSSSKVLYR